MKTKNLFYALLCAATLTAAACSKDDDPTQTGEVVEIPDPAFRAYCLENFDRNGDGKIRQGEIAEVTSVVATDLGIQSMAGIEHFVALTGLSCYNNNLEHLDVSKNANLQQLHCSGNQFTSLELSKNTALRSLFCEENKIDTLDLSPNIALERLDCSLNNLTTLDVSKNAALMYIACYKNGMKYLDVSGCVNLESLYCYVNNLIQLDISNSRKLSYLSCDGNPILISIFIWQGCDPKSYGAKWDVPQGVSYVVVEES